MAQKSARGAISKIRPTKSCGLPCPIRVPNLVRIGWEMAEKSKRFRFCMGPYGNDIQGVPEKIAQSSMHHNFATVHQKVMRFSAKCSERNWLDDNGPYLNTAINFFLFYSWQVNYLKTKLTASF